MPLFVSRGKRPARAFLAAPFVVAAAAGALSACAAPSTAPDAGGIEVRLMVKLVRPAQDGAVIAADASRVAGVPAHYRSMVSASWHALSLRCPDASACERAIDRLRQEKTTFEAIELDGRKRGAVM
jgi:hypothetical protein